MRTIRILLTFFVYLAYSKQLENVQHNSNRTSFFDRLKQQFLKKTDNRIFTGNIANAVNNLNGYGCWCYFYDDFVRGSGSPVDFVDELCKTLHDGYHCAIVDAEINGESCVPWEVDFEPGSATGPNRHTSLYQSCAEKNSEASNCAKTI